MAFINHVSQIMPGFGSPSCNGSITGIAATGSAQTITIANTSTTPSTGGTPFNASGGPPPSGGYVRIKTNSVTGTFTLTSIIVQDSGGNSTQVAGPLAAATAGNVDEIFDFWTDVQITKVIIATTISTAVGTLDVECSLT